MTPRPGCGGCCAPTASWSGPSTSASLLRRIVEAASELVGAPYAALGVIRADGDGLEEFIHVGMDQASVDAVGHPPEGKGLLGALIEDPRPIRLGDLRDDARSIGFPANHPPMRGFLGVPIRVSDEVFGNLYLASETVGDFSVEDEELVSALAATAGVAIKNARLYEEATRRQEWLEASADITQQVLAAPGDDGLRLIALRVSDLADADLVAVVQPDESGSGWRWPWRWASGRRPSRTSATRSSTRSPEPSWSPGNPGWSRTAPPGRRRGGPALMLAGLVSVGPVMLLPLAGAEGVRGVLLVGPGPRTPWLPGARRGSGQHLRLARLRGPRDRRRAARGEPDGALRGPCPDRPGPPRPRDPAAVRLRHEAAARCRRHWTAPPRCSRSRTWSTSWTPRSARSGRRSSSSSPARCWRRVACDRAFGTSSPSVTPMLGLRPQVSFRGPVDAVVDEELLEDVLAVVREALTNVARHARARHVSASVTVSDSLLTIRVEDDGVGVGTAARRSGLANLRSGREHRRRDPGARAGCGRTRHHAALAGPDPLATGRSDRAVTDGVLGMPHGQRAPDPGLPARRPRSGS